MSEQPKETMCGGPARGVIGAAGDAGAVASSGPVPDAASLLPPPAVPTRRSWPWRTLFFGLMIFVCGGIVGAGGTLLAVHRIMVRVMGQGPELSAERATERVTRALGLTEVQARQVQEIYQRRFATVRSDLRESRLRVGAEMTELREEIAKILTPEQAAEWRRRVDLLERSLPARGPGAGLGGANGPGGVDGLGGAGRPAGPNAYAGPNGPGGPGGLGGPNGPGGQGGFGGPNGFGGQGGAVGPNGNTQSFGPRSGAGQGMRAGGAGPNALGFGAGQRRQGQGGAGRLGGGGGLNANPGGSSPGSGAGPGGSASPGGSPSVSPSPSPAEKPGP